MIESIWMYPGANSAMCNLNITLPDSMRLFVEEQIQHGGFASASEYLQSLIHEDQLRKAEEHLESLLLAGIERGEGEEMTPEIWARMHQELQRRIGDRHQNVQ